MSDAARVTHVRAFLFSHARVLTQPCHWWFSLRLVLVLFTPHRTASSTPVFTVPRTNAMRSNLILASLLTLVLCTGHSGANVYPTKPIQKTVFTGGGWNNLTWTDSGSNPPLYSLGVLDIDLYVDEGNEPVCGCPRSPRLITSYFRLGGFSPSCSPN